MNTSCKDFGVFDFNEETEPESSSRWCKSRIQNPNPMDKYNFLQAVASTPDILVMESSKVHGLGVNAINGDHNGDSAISDTSLEAEDNFSAKTILDYNDIGETGATDVEELRQLTPDKIEHRTYLSGEEGSPAAEPASPTINKLLSVVPNILSSEEAVDVVPDATENMCERSSSTSSDTMENDDGSSSDHCGWEMDVDKMAVVCHPDYLSYCDCYYTNSELTFSISGIKAKGSSADGEQISHQINCQIDDIIHIKSHWNEAIEMAVVEIRVLLKDSVKAENGNCALGELKFAVVDRNWYEMQEAITSLNVNYKALWTSMLELDDNIDRSRREVIPENSGQFFKKYFPNFDEPFEEVVYPKGDSDAVSISKRDVDLLQPDTFVNDTIIDFYIKYLKNGIKSEDRHRFHFFNSFFFRKLADPDNDHSNASDGRAAFQRVRKWTRKVNLFEKDYVFIPVNFNYHWSLIVMCHLGEVATSQDEDVNEARKVPCILHMDSIRGSHTGLKVLIQRYLKEEWKERQKETFEDMSSRFDNLRFVSLELPQQQNSFDCGLFLLHYVELFLDEAPINFNPFRITKFSNFLSVDWFQPAEASLKRVVIQRLIYDLLEHRSLEIPSVAGTDNQSTFNCQKTNVDEEVSLHFLQDRCNSSAACHSSVVNLHADQGIEFSLLPSLSSKGSQCDPSSVSKVNFEPGGMLVHEQYSAFSQPSSFDEYKNSMMSIEEHEARNGHLVYAPSMETGLDQLQEFRPEDCSLPYNSQEFKAMASWNTADQAGHEHINSSPQTSISMHEDMVEDGNKNGLSGVEQPSLVEKLVQPSSPLAELVDVVNADANANANADVHKPDNDNMQENGFGYEDSTRLESDMPAAKKLRITPTVGQEEGFSRDLHL